MKICLVSDSFPPLPCGIGAHVFGLWRALESLGQQAHVLTASYGGRFGPEDLGPEVHRVARSLVAYGGFIHVPYGLGLGHEVRRFLEGERFDVVHAHSPFVSVLPHIALRMPAGIHVATYHSNADALPILRASLRLARPLLAGTLRRIDGFIAVSEAALRSLVKFSGLRRQPALVIPNGVDPDRFAAGLPPQPPARAQPPTLLFVSRIEPRKGLRHLVGVLPLVHRARPDVRLIVVGDGPERGPCEALAHSLGVSSSVKFAGRVPGDTLPDYYRRCDLFCAPARPGEAFGIILLEAMASGRPVVASRIPGYDEVVRDGVDGYLVPPDDRESWARAVLALLADPERRASFGANGRERALEYRWEAVARRTVSFYEQLFGLRSRPGK